MQAGRRNRVSRLDSGETDRQAVRGQTMLRRSLCLLLALGLLGLFAELAAAAAPALSGTYKVMITGKPAPLDGRWRLEFLPKRVVHLVRNRKLVVVGTAAPIGTRRLKFVDRSGPYACSVAEGNGVYTFRRVGSRLIFKAVADKCIGRKLILTTKPFSK